MTPDSRKPCPALLGAHFSISGGLDKAIESARYYGCRALQIFTANSRTWKEKEPSEDAVLRFVKARESERIVRIASHTSYLINLASPDREKHERSVQALSREIMRSGRLGIDFVVLHPGSHAGLGEAEGIKRVAQSLRRLIESIPFGNTRLLLETTAGQGTSIGHRFEHLADILAETGYSDRTGVCLDTCHMHASGYDLSSHEGYHATLDAAESVIGLSNIFMIHVNDAKKGCGSRIDRHEHIGKGSIGRDGFSFLMNDSRFRCVPKILETPKLHGQMDMDRVNLNELRDLVQEA